MSVRHSIVMICYNQKEYIRTALDSVLCERVKPYEIIIGDDASTDGTRWIIEEYRNKYPEIIKVILNEKNIGITANFNNVAPKATGEMVHFLSGDDWFKPGLLENMNRKIQELNLDPNTSRFVLLPHCVEHYPDGSEVMITNDSKQLDKYSPVGSVLRQILHTRQVGYSRALFDMWPLFPEDSEQIGPYADLLQHVLFAQHIDLQIIMDCAGAVYRARVGIATRTGLHELENSFHRALVRIISSYNYGDLVLNSVDLKYLTYHECAYRLRISYSIVSLNKVLKLAINLAKTDISEVRFIARDLYVAHRRLAEAFIREWAPWMIPLKRSCNWLWPRGRGNTKRGKRFCGQYTRN